ncbi:uncharacterized protein GLRG_01542 [Colletotrichum graminicola M1.001]|uniref:Uncharacterized protein n=1 Tax=Colletotrichum graminicola (strain M1.001 / M2 / FGSC 10212) TaxID=645133 RepID=E3Q6F0_COLGM|nr:uncharacterized protein GLRG_01542 [Colletotrichum graminicola M1.001]EFQ26398.1 hypothetical protein GLRG_01542 [Colletotrichum graminicola M1.001]
MNDFFFLFLQRAWASFIFLRKEIPFLTPFFLASLRVKHRISAELDFCGLPVFFHTTLPCHISGRGGGAPGLEGLVWLRFGWLGV